VLPIKAQGGEAAELVFKKLCERNGRAIFEIRSNDLHPNGQAGGRPVDRGGGRRQAARRSRICPDEACIKVRICLAIDVEAPRLNRLRMGLAIFEPARPGSPARFAIALSTSTSPYPHPPSDNSIARRHAAMTLTPLPFTHTQPM
jgi:hypothetical protein